MMTGDLDRPPAIPLAGAYADPTGLYKMGHRYYDPTLSHFTQPEPPARKPTAYLYAGCDPINNTEPSST
ncbi:RHS repeat-associated core domain-containing protein [Streptomyces sp. NPDC059409]|uniref:RHS repeat-associated core domain-containing protein n=1 Tax=Streptomyces sp. NPDC059409 TaxID=3346824 RepID=UPI0036C1CEE7